MLQDRIAQRYAKALYELAEEKGKLEAVLADQRGVEVLFRENKDFRRFLASPIITDEKKRTTVEAIFKGKVDDVTENFYEFLTSRGREEIIPQVAQWFIHHFNELHNVQVVKVVTAAELPEAQKEQIKTKLAQQTGARIELSTTVDPSVIGGMSIQVGDRLMDNTVRSTLSRLKQSFRDNPYIREQ